MTGYWQLLPEVLVLVAALVALFGEFLPGRDRGAAWGGAALCVVAAALVVWGGISRPLFGGMLVHDGISQYARVAVPLLTAVWLLWVGARGMGDERTREAVALALLSAVGGMLLVSARELVAFFIAVELSTMPAYVLTGYRRRDIVGLEGTLKYFLLSLLTSLVMLYGLSMLFGVSGSTLYTRIALSGHSALATAGAALVLVGLFAKLSAAPFHYWAPDAYAGASAASVAFVSTVPKVAGTVAAVRLITYFPPPVGVLATVIAVAAAASMVLGNLAALGQTDVRRLMAYSGVAHTGYVLVAVAALQWGAGNAAGIAVFYAVAYAVPSLAIMLIAAEEGVTLESFGQLATRRPAVAWAAVLFLLSLIGIPPLVGFFGKLYVFGTAISVGLYWLAVLGVLMSVVSAGYYFRIVRAMFFGEAPAESAETPAAAALQRSVPASAALALCAVATVLLGVFARVPLQ
jgi:NADH-quinone oxidoreductase subunit N